MELKQFEEKFQKAIEGSSFLSLCQEIRQQIKVLAKERGFTFQQILQLITIASDLTQWGGTTFIQLIEQLEQQEIDDKKRYFQALQDLYQKVRDSEKDYRRFPCPAPAARPLKMIETADDSKILGKCPVASDKTRCCNLWTLDAIKNCGFDCSYCSIQSFYYDDSIYLQSNIEEKLKALELDPQKRYHIGTGQSSDSLLWGNKFGLLEKLFAFAKKHPNVILELKSKSANTRELLSLDIPANVITTWSLNTPTIIANEEHHTASLDQRLEAAKSLMDRGHLIGFHFHPMVIYQGHQAEYQALAERLVKIFDPKLIAMISLGTLTFIKPVLKKLRKRQMASKILQMPMEEIAGKYSYPLEMKRQLFSNFYQSFPKSWQEQIFFYLCMEDASLWPQVFGRSYSNNEDFEKEMMESYFQKIDALRKR